MSYLRQIIEGQNAKSLVITAIFSQPESYQDISSLKKIAFRNSRATGKTEGYGSIEMLNENPAYF